MFKSGSETLPFHASGVSGRESSTDKNHRNRWAVAIRSSRANHTQPHALEESGLVSRLLRDTETAVPLSGAPQQTKSPER